MAQNPQWVNRIVRYGEMPANEFLANPSNPRRHPAAQRDALRGSFDALGIIAPILVNARTQYMIDGHARVEECLSRDENMLIPFIEVDLSPEEEALALASFDWITQMATYDKDALEDLLASIDTDNADMQALLDQLAQENGIDLLDETPLEDMGPEIDRGAELAAKYKTATGQIWQLGKHRLAIGDSTDEGVIAALMDGAISDLALTDPPYGVEMDKGFTGAGGFAGKGKPIPRRQYSDTWDADRPSKDTFCLILEHCKQAIIFGGNFFADLLPQSTHWIVWDKLNTMPTFGDCELAWTNMPRKSVKKFTFEYNGLIGKEKERYHPTQKPLGLFSELLNAYSEAGQIIFDPFLGSGTTLIAAHQTGRICYGSEISVEYAAIVLSRWETLTGDTARLVTPPDTHEIAF